MHLRPMLTLAVDGINAMSLGIIGESEYAVDCHHPTHTSIWRRPATHAHSYGGWRWECMTRHIAQFPTVGDYAAIAAALAPSTEG